MGMRSGLLLILVICVAGRVIASPFLSKTSHDPSQGLEAGALPALNRKDQKPFSIRAATVAATTISPGSVITSTTGSPATTITTITPATTVLATSISSVTTGTSTSSTTQTIATTTMPPTTSTTRVLTTSTTVTTTTYSTSMMTPTPTAGTTSTIMVMTTTSNSSSSCFPASALVEKDDGTHVRMDMIEVGDKIRVAPDAFSEVFMFTHKTTGIKSEHVQIDTDSGHSITLTAGHYIFASRQLKYAGTVSIGDVVTLWNGASSSVTGTRLVMMEGLYNPQTLDGNIVVNGILASTYTQTVDPAFAHAILAPVRYAYGYGLRVLASMFHTSNYGLDMICPHGGEVV